MTRIVGKDATAGERKTMMTVDEVAERWGVNPRTVYGMIAAKKIKVVRVGRLVRISRSHIEFIESGGQAA